MSGTKSTVISMLGALGTGDTMDTRFFPCTESTEDTVETGFP